MIRLLLSTRTSRIIDPSLVTRGTKCEAISSITWIKNCGNHVTNVVLPSLRSAGSLKIILSDHLESKVRQKTQKVKNPVLYLLPITWDDFNIISCDLAHQKRSIYDAPWHDVRSKPGDHWMLTFSHGTRACFFFFCSKVEMFSSSLWKYFIYYFSFLYLRSAKIGFFYISSKQLDK